MGTNYYRIPKKDEFTQIKQKIIDSFANLDDFHFADGVRNNTDVHEIINYDWRDEEGNALIVHLGKRSAGWKFLWNFHRNKFYSNKNELFAFIRSGRVFNECGEELDPEEFIQMALEWCPDGHDSYDPAPCYDFKTGAIIPDTSSRYAPHDTYIDGLRVDTPREHSTYFC